MTPPSSPPRPESPIYEWPFQSMQTPKPLSTIEKVRIALEKCGIVNEHTVQAIMEIIESQK